MDPLTIIKKYYKEDSKAYHILVTHSRMVAKKAVEIAERVPELKPDVKFIVEAAMLHDIGICQCNAPKLDCHGEQPYIYHGIIGSDMLVKEGLAKHALVCERHTGVGISLEDIEKQKLPLPKRDMVPLSIEEEIVCFADCFYSKRPGSLEEEHTVAQIEAELARYGEHKVKKFKEWCKKFREVL